MRLAIGIDVGSTTAKAVVLDVERGVTVRARCERHRGRPHQLVPELLAEALAAAPKAPLGVTGSIGLGLTLPWSVHATPVHEVHAVARAVRARAPATRTVVELGGQDAKIIVFAAEGADAEMNDRCAAGTGATLDRIVRRLGLGPMILARARPRADLRVAARCGVFAETDVVNFVQRGVPVEDALGALLHAIVIQNLAVLARGRTLRGPVLLLGGPHAHVPGLAQAWRECLEAIWGERGLDPAAVEVPPEADLHAAIGAALHAHDGGLALAPPRRMVEGARVAPPLIETPSDRERLARLRPAPPPRLGAGRHEVHLGLDAGSTTTKVAAIDRDGTLLASSYGPSTGDTLRDAITMLDALTRDAATAGASLDVRSLGITGYGAPFLAEALDPDAVVVETLAHAEAARAALPDLDAVVDVGGTDVKVLELRDGRVADFHLGSQCAAGHGAFLAATAAELGIPLESAAEHALAADHVPGFTIGCAIFMETDRVTFQRDGWAPAAILAGLAWAVARTVWEFVVAVPPERIGRRFLLTGGTHRNAAVALAMARTISARILGAEVVLHPHPELCGAIGAARLGAEAASARGATRWRGLDAVRGASVQVERGAELRCTRCEVRCDRTLVTARVAGRPGTARIAGNACARGADVASTGRRTAAHAPDLFADDARRSFRRPRPLDGAPDLEGRTPRFGIPRVMGLYRCAPLLLHYLRGAGVSRDRILVGPATSEALLSAGTRWGSTDPCFPAKVVPAHVAHLVASLRPGDRIVLPSVTHARIDPHGTADCASCPIVAACAHTALAALRREGDILAAAGVEPVIPRLSLADPAQLDAELWATLGAPLGIDRARHQRALAHGLAAQRGAARIAHTRGHAVLARARRGRRAVALVLSRPYHADPGVQHGISTELAARGIPVLGICSLPRDEGALLDLSSVLPRATNSGDAEKVWAARAVAADPALVAVDLSSFRCGQDAALLGILGDLLDRPGKPALRLHDLDEDRPGVSLRVRVDTFAETVRAYERDVLRRAS